MDQAPTSTEPAQPDEQEDGLISLHKRLEPLARGLQQQAKTNAKGFFLALPRIISGTIVVSILELIREVAERDQNHENRLLQLEAMAEEAVEENPQVAFLADMLFYIKTLEGLVDLADITDPGALEIIARMKAHQEHIVGILEQLGLGPDGKELDEGEEAADGQQEDAAPTAD